MSITRRSMLGSAAAMGVLSAFLTPEQLLALESAQTASTQPEVELPHNSPAFWNGFYDSAINHGSKASDRGADSLADEELETQYLHFKADEKKLRYATAIQKEELLDHEGDTAISILMNQFHSAKDDKSQHINPSQLRVDVTQNHPIMNILAPLAWTSLASISPDKAGKMPTLDQLHFKSDQVMNASGHILLTKGSGKLAVNISRTPRDSNFHKVLTLMIAGAKMAAPYIALPAVSVPAMAAFSEAFSYWENRTQFVINGNLVNAASTKTAADDQELRAPVIGLVPGDYLIVAKKDTEMLDKMLSKLMLHQGYLVHQDVDLNQQIEHIVADGRNPEITYATVRVGIQPVTGSSSEKPAAESTSTTTTTTKKATTTTKTTPKPAPK